MYKNYIKEDFRRNKAIGIIIILFVAASSLLLSIVSVLSFNLIGSIDTLMDRGKTPHFLQMHAGDLPEDELDKFASQNENIEAYQLSEFLNFDGSKIILGENSLASSQQDNGFSMQNEKFDFLLDMNNEIIQPKKGELFVPITYYSENKAKLGDKASVGNREFIVAGFLRDSQMNSTLSSSKRFLISEEDFKGIRDQGIMEYLIEYRLHNLDKLTEFEGQYKEQGLPGSGPTITWPLFRMINGISDGIMISLLILVGFLILGISLLSLRFILHSKIEEDLREIGVLKAIGFRVSEIQKLYLANFAFLIAIGSLLGYSFSYLVQDYFLENMKLYLGAEISPITPIISYLFTLLLSLGILFFILRILNRFKKISVLESLHGLQDKGLKKSDLLPLWKNKGIPTNYIMAIRDILSRKSLYFTMLFVVIIASFIIIVPHNMHHTLSDEGFASYMGVGPSDLYLSMLPSEYGKNIAKEVSDHLAKDEDIYKFTTLSTYTYPVKNENNTAQYIRIELGDHKIFPLEYLEGKIPENEKEISLSTLLAEEIEKSVGDEIVILLEGQEKVLTVSGIYSDITNGGKTAKAIFADNSQTPIWTTFTIKLKDPSILQEKITEYDSFESIKSSGVKDTIDKTFGNTLNAISLAAKASTILSISTILLITILFIRLLLNKDVYTIGVLKAIGFRDKDIKIQYVFKSMTVILMGILLGSLLSKLIGEKFTELLIASFGVRKFTFTPNPLFNFIIAPLMLILPGFVGIYLSTRNVSAMTISKSIKE